MDVRAIVVIGTHSDEPTGSAYALTDVLGKPIAFRVIDTLKQQEVTKISVITDASSDEWPVGTALHGTWIATKSEQLWKSVEQTFHDFSQSGAELILLIRLGAYCEVDFSDLIRFHLDGGARITSAVDGNGVPLDVCVLDPSSGDELEALLNHDFRESAGEYQFYSYTGYINRLSTPNHLRQLAIEALMQRIHMEPEGEQVKPGVWLGRGAQVHKRARVLSPAFIGAGSRVRAAAVVTRCSALEHHTIVDCGTVIENTTTMPYTYLGAGLDVTHAVVGHSKLFNLKRGVEVEFSDPRLIGEASSRAPLRALGSLVSLASFFPAQLLRGLFAPSHRECPVSLPDAIATPAAALEAPATIKATAPAVDAGEFPSQLVIARRYGNE